MICVTLFARCASQQTHGHARIARETPARATKSDTSGHCLACITSRKGQWLRWEMIFSFQSDKALLDHLLPSSHEFFWIDVSSCECGAYSNLSGCEWHLFSSVELCSVCTRSLLRLHTCSAIQWIMTPHSAKQQCLAVLDHLCVHLSRSFPQSAFHKGKDDKLQK